MLKRGTNGNNYALDVSLLFSNFPLQIYEECTIVKLFFK